MKEKFCDERTSDWVWTDRLDSKNSYLYTLVLSIDKLGLIYSGFITKSILSIIMWTSKGCFEFWSVLRTVSKNQCYTPRLMVFCFVLLDHLTIKEVKQMVYHFKALI